MKGRAMKTKPKTLISTICIAFVMIGCNGAPETFPRFYLSVLNPDELPQTYFTSDLTEWGQGHIHQDLAGIRGGAISINPLSTLQHIAYLYPSEPSSDQRSLQVITGLGHNTWSEAHAHLDLESALVPAAAPSISYLTNNVFGIAWAENQKVYTAAFNASASEVTALTAGPVLEEDVLTSQVTGVPSMAFNNDQVLLVWEWGTSGRGVIVSRGELAGNELIFDPPVQHSISNTAISNVVADNGNYYFVSTHRSTNDFSYKAYASEDGLEWSVEQSCSRPVGSEEIARIVSLEDGSLVGLISEPLSGSDSIGRLSLYEMASCSKQELEIEHYRLYSNLSLAHLP